MPVLPSTPINSQLERCLLQAARDSIQHGLRHHRALQPDLKDYPEQLAVPGASFVTLTKAGTLRGCIGSIQAYQPLLLDVVQHAFDAAFRDSRFATLDADEYSQLSVHVSVLSPPQSVPDGLSEAQLLDRLVPEQDGLILRQGNRRAVFLPQVWKQLPDPQQFLMQLKLKGGWMPDSWPDDMQTETFRVQEFGDGPAV